MAHNHPVDESALPDEEWVEHHRLHDVLQYLAYALVTDQPDDHVTYAKAWLHDLRAKMAANGNARCCEGVNLMTVNAHNPRARAAARVPFQPPTDDAGVHPASGGSAGSATSLVFDGSGPGGTTPNLMSGVLTNSAFTQSMDSLVPQGSAGYAPPPRVLSFAGHPSAHPSHADRHLSLQSQRHGGSTTSFTSVPSAGPSPNTGSGGAAARRAGSGSRPPIAGGGGTSPGRGAAQTQHPAQNPGHGQAVGDATAGAPPAAGAISRRTLSSDTSAFVMSALDGDPLHDGSTAMRTWETIDGARGSGDGSSGHQTSGHPSSVDHQSSATGPHEDNVDGRPNVNPDQTQNAGMLTAQGTTTTAGAELSVTVSSMQSGESRSENRSPQPDGRSDDFTPRASRLDGRSLPTHGTGLEGGSAPLPDQHHPQDDDDEFTPVTPSKQSKAVQMLPSGTMPKLSIDVVDGGISSGISSGDASGNTAPAAAIAIATVSSTTRAAGVGPNRAEQYHHEGEHHAEQEHLHQHQPQMVAAKGRPITTPHQDGGGLSPARVPHHESPGRSPRNGGRPRLTQTHKVLLETAIELSAEECEEAQRTLDRIIARRMPLGGTRRPASRPRGQHPSPSPGQPGLTAGAVAAAAEAAEGESEGCSNIAAASTSVRTRGITLDELEMSQSNNIGTAAANISTSIDPNPGNNNNAVAQGSTAVPPRHVSPLPTPTHHVSPHDLSGSPRPVSGHRARQRVPIGLTPTIVTGSPPPAAEVNSATFNAAAAASPSPGPKTSPDRGGGLRRIAVSDAPLDDDLEDSEIHDIPKSDEEMKNIREAMQAGTLFSNLDDTVLERISRAMARETFDPATEILTQGMPGRDTFYLIISGAAEIIKNGRVVAKLGRGSYFGELELMYNATQCEATVKTVTTLDVYTLRKVTYKTLLLRQTVTKRSKFLRLLRQVTFFDVFSEYDREVIAEALVTRNYAEGQRLVTCGERVEVLSIILDGTVHVSARDDMGHIVDLGITGKGKVVGELELLFGHTAVADVVAHSKNVKAALLTKRHFDMLTVASTRDNLIRAIANDKDTFSFYLENCGPVTKRAIAAAERKSAARRRLSSMASTLGQPLSLGGQSTRTDSVLDTVGSGSSLRDDATTRAYLDGGISVNGEIVFGSAEGSVFRFPLEPLQADNVCLVGMQEDGTILHWNEGMMRATQFHINDVIGRSIYALLGDEQSQQQCFDMIRSAAEWCGDWEGFQNNGLLQRQQLIFTQSSQIAKVRVSACIVPAIASIDNADADVILLMGHELKRKPPTKNVNFGQWFLEPFTRAFNEALEVTQASLGTPSPVDMKRHHSPLSASNSHNFLTVEDAVAVSSHQSGGSRGGGAHDVPSASPEQMSLFPIVQQQPRKAATLEAENIQQMLSLWSKCKRVVDKFQSIASTDPTAVIEDWQPVSIETLLRRMQTTLTSECASRKNKLQIKSDEAPQGEIFLDAAKLPMVLHHLVRNASNHNMNVAITVTARIDAPTSLTMTKSCFFGASVTDLAGGGLPAAAQSFAGGMQSIAGAPSGQQFVTFEVKDNGKGISQELIDSFRTAHVMGKGVGLRKAFQQVKLMGGTFDIASYHGTTVTVTLPLIEAQPDKTAEDAENRATFTTVLVEREAVQRNFFCQYLWGRRHAVLPAQSWRDVLSMLKTAPVDLFIIDPDCIAEAELKETPADMLSGMGMSGLAAATDDQMGAPEISGGGGGGNVGGLTSPLINGTAASSTNINNSNVGGAANAHGVSPLDPVEILKQYTYERSAVVILTSEAFDDEDVAAYGEEGMLAIAKPCALATLHMVVERAEIAVTRKREEAAKIQQMRQTFAQTNRGAWKKGKMLGKGAFGEVFEAIDVLTGGKMAVKVVKVTADNKAQAQELVEEIRTMTTLQHENIIHYFYCEENFGGEDSGVGEAADSKLNIFMELAPGGTLQERVKQCDGGKLQVQEISRVVQDVLAGITYIHSHGYVHCDIKSANVLLDADGRCKLGDFGTAKKLRDGQLMYETRGTPLYMAPEVLNATVGDAENDEEAVGFDVKADVWSLGCMVMEMATGRSPFSHIGKPMNVMNKISSLGKDEKPDLSPLFGADPRVFEFIEACLQVDTEQRMTARELASLSLLTDNADTSVAQKVLRRAELAHRMNKFVAFGDETAAAAESHDALKALLGNISTTDAAFFDSDDDDDEDDDEDGGDDNTLDHRPVIPPIRGQDVRAPAALVPSAVAASAAPGGLHSSDLRSALPSGGDFRTQLSGTAKPDRPNKNDTAGDQDDPLPSIHTPFAFPQMASMDSGDYEAVKRDADKAGKDEGGQVVTPQIETAGSTTEHHVLVASAVIPREVVSGRGARPAGDHTSHGGDDEASAHHRHAHGWSPTTPGIEPPSPNDLSSQPQSRQHTSSLDSGHLQEHHGVRDGAFPRRGSLSGTHTHSRASHDASRRFSATGGSISTMGISGSLGSGKRPPLPPPAQQSSAPSSGRQVPLQPPRRSGSIVSPFMDPVAHRHSSLFGPMQKTTESPGPLAPAGTMSSLKSPDTGSHTEPGSTAGLSSVASPLGTAQLATSGSHNRSGTAGVAGPRAPGIGIAPLSLTSTSPSGSGPPPMSPGGLTAMSPNSLTLGVSPEGPVPSAAPPLLGPASASSPSGGGTGARASPAVLRGSVPPSPNFASPLAPSPMAHAARKKADEIRASLCQFQRFRVANDAASPPQLLSGAQSVRQESLGSSGPKPGSNSGSHLRLPGELDE